ncbi:MAG: histidine kinase [Mariprofundaceae bacterium]|nr:histidine kinase [Mariprofundaceae bacterium]
MNENHQHNTLMRQNLELIEHERRELAHELHDEVGQNLTAIRTAAQLICRQSEGRQSYPVAHSIITLTDQMFHIIHQLLNKLRPSALDKLGLEDAIHDIATFMRQHMHLQCTLELHGELESLDPDLQLALYRIIQEALTNAVRHGKAKKAAVFLSVGSQQLGLSITNNGQPLSDHFTALLQAKSSGIGLLGIQHRVHAWQGKISLVNTETGVDLSCTIPLGN